MKFYETIFCDEADGKGDITLGYFRKYKDAKKCFDDKCDKIREDYQSWHIEYTEEHPYKDKSYTIFDEGEWEKVIVWVSEHELQ